MPFTFSHAAAVLPFKRWTPRYLDLPALMIGSFAPDLGYFVWQFGFAKAAHSLEGTLWACLPVGLACWFLFNWARRELAVLSPVFMSGAPIYFLEKPLVNLLKILFSLWLGSLTHIFWDSFTHGQGLFGVLDFLRQVVFHIQKRPVYLYQVLQHLSSAIGALALGWAYWRWLGKQKISLGQSVDFKKLSGWLLFLFALVLGSGLSTSYGDRLEVFLFYTVVKTIAALGLSLVLAVLILKFRSNLANAGKAS